MKHVKKILNSEKILSKKLHKSIMEMQKMLTKYGIKVNKCSRKKIRRAKR